MEAAVIRTEVGEEAEVGAIITTEGTITSQEEAEVVADIIEGEVDIIEEAEEDTILRVATVHLNPSMAMASMDMEEVCFISQSAFLLMIWLKLSLVRKIMALIVDIIAVALQVTLIIYQYDYPE